MFCVNKLVKVTTLSQFNRRTFSQVTDSTKSSEFLKKSELSNQKEIKELSAKITEMNAQLTSMKQVIPFIATLTFAGWGMAIGSSFH